MLVPLLLVLGSQTALPAALPDATALLDRREGALGTVDARAKVRGIVFRGRVTMTGTKMSAKFEERQLLTPGGAEKVLHELTWAGWGKTTQGTDGTVSWSTDPGFEGIMVKEGASQGAPRRFWAIARSAPWRTLYASARTLAKTERDGRALYELEMQPRESGPGGAGAAERWFLDVETNELARVALVFPGPTGERLPMEFAFGDWKAVDGVLYPHRRVQELQGAQFVEGEAMPESSPEAHAPMTSFVYTCESIAHAELTAAEVAPPPEVADAIRDPSKRAQAPGADATACKVETHEKTLVASIRITIPASKVSESLAQLFPEISGVLAARGIQPAGPPFSRYHRIDREKNEIDLEAGISVGAAFEPKGRVQCSELPGGRTAMTWHIGPYHMLQESYDRLGAWIEHEKLKTRAPFWEIYWTDPGLEPDPSTWRTQILWPVE